MTTVRNKTSKPVSVPLPGGRTLHLSPAGSGQIAAKAAQSAAVTRLVEAGEIEIEAGRTQRAGGHEGTRSARGGGGAHSVGGAMRRSGDR
jgi:hypothetical protein